MVVVVGGEGLGGGGGIGAVGEGGCCEIIHMLVRCSQHV